MTIQEDGETAYFTSLPVKAMVQNIKDAGIPSALSYTAGSYVCNYLMYTLLYLIDRKYPNIRGGFIHVPYAMEQVVNKPLGTPSMDLHQIARGLEKAAEAGVKAEDILDADHVLATRETAVRMGLNGEYFMSGRIVDLECAYSTLWGFLQGRGEEEGRGDIWVMFDNEEVGSSSRQGAQGTLMADVLARIEESMGVSREQSIRARTNCLLLSADNGHAIHPNHPEKSDQKLPVNMGGGVILKYNARQTYTTSGFTGAAFTAICKKAGVPVQVFANRADVPGGSTLGNLLGRQILMPMVDIGAGQLAMHSAMETASCKDAEYLANACAAYYNTPIFQPEDGQWKLGL